MPNAADICYGQFSLGGETALSTVELNSTLEPTKSALINRLLHKFSRCASLAHGVDVEAHFERRHVNLSHSNTLHPVQPFVIWMRCSESCCDTQLKTKWQFLPQELLISVLSQVADTGKGDFNQRPIVRLKRCADI